MIRLYDLCKTDMFVVISGRRVLFRDCQTDGVFRTVVDACHTHLTIFHYVDCPLFFQFNTSRRTDPCTDSAADAFLCHLINVFPLLCRDGLLIFQIFLMPQPVFFCGRLNISGLDVSQYIFHAQMRSALPYQRMAENYLSSSECLYSLPFSRIVSVPAVPALQRRHVYFHKSGSEKSTLSEILPFFKILLP